MRASQLKSADLILQIIARISDDIEWKDWHNDTFYEQKDKYIRYSNELKQTRDLELFCRIIIEMLDQKLYPNKFFFPQMIKKFGRIQVNYAIDIFNIAEKYGLANAATYNSTIDAIAKSREPDVALVMQLFNEAKGLRFENAVTYNSTIDAIAKSREPDVARVMQLFNEAKGLRFADAFTYNSTIDVLVTTRNLDLAREIFYEGIKDNLIKMPILQIKIKDKSYLIDLHDYSFGTAYVGLREVLSDPKINLNTISVIYGRGAHSKNFDENGNHPLKAAVNFVLRDMGIKGIQDEKNPGRMHIIKDEPSISKLIKPLVINKELPKKGASDSNNPKQSGNPSEENDTSSTISTPNPSTKHKKSKPTSNNNSTDEFTPKNPVPAYTSHNTGSSSADKSIKKLPKKQPNTTVPEKSPPHPPNVSTCSRIGLFAAVAATTAVGMAALYYKCKM